jgi:hypothetical protein
VLTALAFAVALFAQEGPPDGTGEVATFEVASVKSNKNGISNAIPPLLRDGGYSASNVAVKSVIANAYQVRIFQIEGSRDWLRREGGFQASPGCIGGVLGRLVPRHFRCGGG